MQLRRCVGGWNGWTCLSVALRQPRVRTFFIHLTIELQWSTGALPRTCYVTVAPTHPCQLQELNVECRCGVMHRRH